MASSNTNLRVTELDFDSIKANFTTYLGNQNQFQDYNFEGSGMSILLDQLAYTTHYMGMYTNLLGNEMFADTAQLRPSIISHAKHLNYLPGSVTSATALVNIQVTPNPISEDTTANTITLQKYTRLLATSVDGVNHQFVTINANTAGKVNGSFLFSNVWIKQGEVTTQQYLMSTDNTTARFTIPTSNVDTDTLLISVQQSVSNTYKETYTLETDLTEVKSNTRVFWLEENSDSNGYYTIYFGDNIIGKRPANGSIIVATYLESEGEYANKLNRFVFTDPIDGEYSSNVIVTSLSRSAGGSDRESIEEIRQRAPIHYTSQNRAVTKDDYELLILRDYPNIDAVSVWSGADNKPPVYGKVFISLKPKENFEISLAEKERIKNEIITKRSIMTVIPEIIDPNYTYLLINVDVYYNPNRTNLTSSQLEQLVRQRIIDYKESDLQRFDSVYRNSKLHRLIDTAEPSILSNNIELYVQKRIELDFNSTKTYTMEFDIPLKRSGFPYQAYTYPTVQCTCEVDPNLTRDTLFEVTPDSFTGLDSISIVNPGSGYTGEPTVTITGDGTGATAQAIIVNGRIQSIVLTNRGLNYSRATVAITGGGGAGAVATAVLGFSTGVLRRFYYNSLGEKIIYDANAGTINFNTGVVKFIDFNALSITENSFYADNIVTFNVQPDTENIYPLRNRILDIDANDPNSIQINMVAET